MKIEHFVKPEIYVAVREKKSNFRIAVMLCREGEKQMVYILDLSTM